MHLFLLASWLGILDVLSVAFQDSQASQGSQLMSQASQASALGELLQNTELETGDLTLFDGRQLSSFLFLAASLLLVVRPGAPSSYLLLPNQSTKCFGRTGGGPL